MINVSTTYDNLIANGGQYEWRVAQGNTYYGRENIMGGTITRTEFTRVSVGCCTAATLDLNLWGVSSLSTDTPLTVQFRATDGVTSSEWYTKGIFFIDTIESSPYSEVTHITAYDAMLKTNVVYMTSGTWTQPTTLEVLQDIADDIGVTIEPNTYDLFDILSRTLDISVNIGANGTTERELLSIMGVMYACNFIINDAGQLKATSPGIAQFALANVGDAVVSFDASPAERITKAKVWLNATTYFRTPSIAAMTEEQFDALPGVRLEVECPFYASQSISDYLISYFGTKDFIPYNAQGAFLDPKYEIEDSVKIKNITSYITNQSISLDPLAQSNLELESYQALQSHYPYINQAKQEAARNEERIQQVVSEANYREQTIYKSALSGTNTMPAYTTWVTDATGNQNTWTTTRPVYDSAYPVLFVATQRQSVEQSSGTTCSCTTPVKDQTTTVIDGGHITTGTIDAAVVNVTNLDADNIVAGTISDASGVNYWDLDNGELVTKKGEIGGFDINQYSLHTGTIGVGATGSQLSPNGVQYTYYNQNQGSTTEGSFQAQSLQFRVASSGDTSFIPSGYITPENPANGYGQLALYVDPTDQAHIRFYDADDTSVSYPIELGYKTVAYNGLVVGANGSDYPKVTIENGGITTANNVNIRSTESMSEYTLGISGNTYHGGALTLRSTDANRLALGVSHRNSGGTDNVNYWDVYYLPDSGTNNSTKNYKIITTNNLTDIPDASTTERGLVSTGDQEFAGQKTLPSPIIKPRTGTAGGAVFFDTFDDLQNGVFMMSTYNAQDRYSLYRFQFREHSLSSSTNEPLTNYESFRLPSPDFDRTANASYDILTSKAPVTIAQGGTGQTGQTAQQSYTPTVKIGTTAQTVSSLSAYYKSWGLMKLIGGRFNLTTTGTGSLIISLPTGFTVPTSAVQPMGILIAPDQKAYHIRVTADGLAAMSNGGSNVAWATGYYCFWAVVMGN